MHEPRVLTVSIPPSEVMLYRLITNPDVGADDYVANGMIEGKDRLSMTGKPYRCRRRAVLCPYMPRGLKAGYNLAESETGRESVDRRFEPSGR